MLIKEEIKNKIFTDILDETNTLTTSDIIRKHCSTYTWYKWLNEDPDLGGEFRLIKRKYAVDNREDLIESAKECLIDNIYNGDSKTAMFVLKSLTLEYSDKNIIEKLTQEAAKILFQDPDISDEVLNKIEKAFRSLGK